MRSLAIQAEIWRNILIPVQPNKSWAVDLAEDPATITRWAAGQGPCSLDDLARARLALLAEHRTAAANALRDRVIAAFGEAEPSTPARPIDLVAGLHTAAGEAVSELLAAVADGVITAEERDAVARDLDSLEAQIERARATLRGAR